MVSAVPSYWICQCMSSPLYVLHPPAARIQSRCEFTTTASQVQVVEHIVQLPSWCQIWSIDMYCSSCNTLVYCESSMWPVELLWDHLVYICMFGRNDHAHHGILIISSWLDSMVCTIFLCTSESRLSRLPAHCSQRADHTHGASTSPMKNCAPAQAESNLGSRT